MNQIDNIPIAELDNIADGAIAQRFSHAMSEVVRNIADLNTSATKPRKVTIIVAVKPHEDREGADFAFDVKTTLQSRRPITTEMRMAITDSGEVIIKEVTKQIPGQMDMQGNTTTPRIAHIRPVNEVK